MDGRSDNGQGESFREEAALEKRQWVRLTRVCNNRCAFCLDSGAHDGTFADKSDVVDELSRGRRRGATRAVLSGGEPTIHPDFVDLVSEAKKLGYEWVQVITNGRMFAYRRFLSEALEAGLSEITFSLPAHRKELFDRLVGVAGAFEQSVAGLKNALASGSVVVSVDVVINKLNIACLAEIVRYYLELGVREFDLLQMVPFGRAFDRGHEAGGPLAYDPACSTVDLREALELGSRPGVVMWTNRLDPVHLEGFEHLIQDPHKLHDEVRGRIAELSKHARGEPMRCYHPARCPLCFLRRYCEHLGRERDALSSGVFRFVRVRDVAEARAAARLIRAGRSSWKLWIEAETGERAAEMAHAACADGLGAGSEVALDLERWGDRAIAGAVSGRWESFEPCRAVIHSPEDGEALLAASGQGHRTRQRAQVEVALGLNRATAEWLAALEPAELVAGWRVFLEERATLSESRQKDVCPKSALDSPAGREVIAEGVPICLSGEAGAAPEPDVLDMKAIDREGFLEPQAFVDLHIARGYRAFSPRCFDCRFRQECAGLPINLARSLGLSVLSPF